MLSDGAYNALDQYEWKEEGKGYREWLIPAAVINKYWWPK